MEHSILVPIAEGTEELEAVGIIDVLRRAEADVDVASVGELQITASRGTRITADVTLSRCKNKSYDVIALPGGIPGAYHLRDCDDLIEMLKRQKEKGGWIAAICAAPAVVLAHHGLLGGLKATCHPAFAHEIENKAAMDSRVVVDGGFVTSRGAGTAVEFALMLVSLLFDEKKTASVADAMLARY
ncbi:MAG: DJ-1/PfpI family protein [Desulfobacterales bacterium]